MSQSVFGAHIGAYDLEQRIVLVLTERLPTYIAELAMRRGAAEWVDDPDFEPDPEDPDAPVPQILVVKRGFPIRWRGPIIVAKDFKDWPERRLPCIQVSVSDQPSAPKRSDDGLHAETWPVDITVVVGARDRTATRFIRGVYEDAIDWCIQQHQSLLPTSGEGWSAAAIDRVFKGPSEPVDLSDARTLQGAAILFDVTVEGCFDRRLGPRYFAPDPGPGEAPLGEDLPAYSDDETVAEDGATVDLAPVATDEEMV